MKPKCLLFSFLIFFSQHILGQVVQKTRLVKIPSENGLVAVVSQSDCPLKIIGTDLLTKEDGAYPIVRYVLKSTSKKPIRYFSVSFAYKFTIDKWHQFGSGAEDGIGKPDGTGPDLLFQGNTYSNWQHFEIVPITREVKELLSSKTDEMTLKFIGVGMVTKVIYADGSIFDAEKKSRNLYDLLLLSDQF